VNLKHHIEGLAMHRVCLVVLRYLPPTGRLLTILLDESPLQGLLAAKRA
jgi:hypothetical protein